MARATRRPAIAAVWAFLSTRFPLLVYGPAILVTYYCALWLYDSAAGTPGPSWTSAIGAISLVLIFLQARLVDDIQDFQDDAQQNRVPGAWAPASRRGLVLGLAFTTAAIIALNWGRSALWVALASVAIMLAASFILAPLLSRTHPGMLTTGNRVKDAILFIAFEGAHVFTLLYIYCFWTSLPHPGLPIASVALATGLFWTTYAFWKYARFATRPSWNPFGMSWQVFRPALAGLLLLCLICQAGVGVAMDLSALYLGYALGITGLFMLWLVRMSPMGAAGGGATGLQAHLGLLFVAAVDLGLVLALLGKSLGGSTLPSSAPAAHLWFWLSGSSA
jgi:hypothetical protein